MTASDDFVEDNVAWLELQAPSVPWSVPTPVQVAFVPDGDVSDFTDSNEDWLALQTPMVPWMTLGR